MRAARLFLIWVLSALLITSATTALALDPEVRKLVEYETQYNAAATRSDKPVAIQHYEIPLEMLEKDFSFRTPPEISDSLVFTRDGRRYVRWIINPEDTKWHLEVAEFLRTSGLDATPKTYFTGYQTASRSYIVEDPVNKSQFSVKVSTDHTGGSWKDKKQEWSDSQDIRRMADLYHSRIKDLPPRYMIGLDEPVAFGIKKLDQGMVVRLLNDLPTSGRYYVPGFSVLHEEFGRELARIHGSKNPAQYWNEHYNKPLARALAEFAVLIGGRFDSPHSQNFLVELDAKLKPTGRIVLRDFGDLELFKEFYESMGRVGQFNAWPQSNQHSRKFTMSVGLLHGNQPPSWMTAENYARWGQNFFSEFEAEFAKQTGIPRPEISIRDAKPSAHSGFSYFSKVYAIDSSGWQKFFTAQKSGPAAFRSLRCEGLFR